MFDIKTKICIPYFIFQYFHQILANEPNHIQAQHNLCVVLVEEGKWFEAEKCLQDVAQLAPREDYIQKHLQIVRAQIRKIRSQQRQQETGKPKGADRVNGGL